MNFSFETFHKFDFTGSQITAHNVWQSQEMLLNLNLEGSFENGQYKTASSGAFGSVPLRTKMIRILPI